MPLSSVDLPEPFGPTIAVSDPARKRPIEMVHRRMPVIAQRQIVELDRGAHSSAPIAIQISCDNERRDRRRAWHDAHLGKAERHTLRHSGAGM